MEINRVYVSVVIDSAKSNHTLLAQSTLRMYCQFIRSHIEALINIVVLFCVIVMHTLTLFSIMP